MLSTGISLFSTVCVQHASQAHPQPHVCANSHSCNSPTISPTRLVTATSLEGRTLFRHSAIALRRCSGFRDTRFRPPDLPLPPLPSRKSSCPLRLSYHGRLNLPCTNKTSLMYHRIAADVAHCVPCIQASGSVSDLSRCCMRNNSGITPFLGFVRVLPLAYFLSHVGDIYVPKIPTFPPPVVAAS